MLGGGHTLTAHYLRWGACHRPIKQTAAARSRREPWTSVWLKRLCRQCWVRSANRPTRFRSDLSVLAARPPRTIEAEDEGDSDRRRADYVAVPYASMDAAKPTATARVWPFLRVAR